MKYKINLYLIIVLILFTSCTTIKEGEYKNYTYENIILKKGTPNHDNIFILNNNYIGYEIEPDYSLYFTLEELENNVQVRLLIWENIFNNRLLIWLKNINGQWISFDSVEYNSTFIKF
ncbi:MAG: hypothetical protein FWD47_08800 [Treponema sp.]|nr:hypothetical protein [Treponema sp.]